MSTEAIVLLLGGVGTFIVSVLGAIRLLTGDRFQRKVSESAALLSGYTEMVSNLRQEITDMRTAHGVEVERQQRVHRTELDNQAMLHKAERDRMIEERIRLEERIETLEAQMAAILFRPPTLRERQDDQPEP